MLLSHRSVGQIISLLGQWQVSLLWFLGVQLVSVFPYNHILVVVNILLPLISLYILTGFLPCHVSLQRQIYLLSGLCLAACQLASMFPSVSADQAQHEWLFPTHAIQGNLWLLSSFSTHHLGLPQTLPLSCLMQCQLLSHLGRDHSGIYNRLRLLTFYRVL